MALRSISVNRIRKDDNLTSLKYDRTNTLNTISSKKTKDSIPSWNATDSDWFRPSIWPTTEIRQSHKMKRDYRKVRRHHRAKIRWDNVFCCGRTRTRRYDLWLRCRVFFFFVRICIILYKFWRVAKRCRSSFEEVDWCVEKQNAGQCRKSNVTIFYILYSNNAYRVLRVNACASNCLCECVSVWLYSFLLST